jgi:hypothetical protein
MFTEDKSKTVHVFIIYCTVDQESVVVVGVNVTAIGYRENESREVMLQGHCLRC